MHWWYLLFGLSIVAGGLAGFCFGCMWHERTIRRGDLDLDGRWRRWAEDKGRR